MHLECPECKTKFLIDPAKLGDKGRKVRCGKCSHIWHQEPAAPEQAKLEADVKKEQAENLRKAAQQKARKEEPALPVVYEKKHAPKFLKIAAAVLLFVNIITFVMLSKDIIGQTKFYDLIGQYNTAGVMIDDVQMLAPHESEEKMIYSIDWRIKNNSKSKRELPARRISLLDADMQPLLRSEIASGDSEGDGGVLAAGGIFEYKSNTVEDLGKLGRYIALEIGNPFELSTR
ncbi:MAG: hypothetical protein COV36_03655 [Alphaproteobacteria bacterium CG11_big_fil_rev_8_21_14_0_20_44_7]|nr:MAG: hypothetical protein COV36_03655 [Alphaproteobacteria bacterium CG11_big_fil_rev_8_21_14_0_20_44_7]